MEIGRAKSTREPRTRVSEPAAARRAPPCLPRQPQPNRLGAQSARSRPRRQRPASQGSASRAASSTAGTQARANLVATNGASSATRTSPHPATKAKRPGRCPQASTNRNPAPQSVAALPPRTAAISGLSGRWSLDRDPMSALQSLWRARPILLSAAVSAPH